MKFISLSAVLALSAAIPATTALAGSAEAPQPDLVIEAPAPVSVAPVSNWTGGYVGLNFGALRAQTGGNDEQGATYGAFAGYDYDLGDLVIGGELEYQGLSDFTVSGVDVDDVTRLKARLGADLGDVMVYGVAGAARVGTSVGSDNGYLYGLGAEYLLTQSFSVGAELLDHRFDDVNGTGADIDAQTLTLRGAFRF